VRAKLLWLNFRHSAYGVRRSTYFVGNVVTNAKK
jgi:hypothetical protein